MEVVELINTIIGIAFAVCYAYQFFYILVALLGRSKYIGKDTYQQ